MMDINTVAMSFLATWGVALAGLWIYYRSGISVKPFESVLLMRFGRCIEEIKEPGFHFRPVLWIPGYSKIKVSKQLVYERISDLHLNDVDGTTMRVDLWIECRVNDAQKSAFAVESWQEAMKNLVTHTMVSKAGALRLGTILSDRTAFTQEILDEVRAEVLHWGISIEQLWIQDLRLLPEIVKQFFDRVAAQLELKKSRLEEEGRIRIQMLQAETEKQVAHYQATARSMQPLAVGRAYEKLGELPGVLGAYEKLYQLSLLQPQKVVSFVGFKDGEIRPMDALMIPGSDESGPHKGPRPQN